MKTGKMKRISSATLAIFLAVIMAVTFGWGSSLQKVYADVDDGDCLELITDDETLYSDGSLEIQIQIPSDIEGTEGTDWTLHAAVGLNDNEDNDEEIGDEGLEWEETYDNPDNWFEVFDEGDLYSFNSRARTITLNGDKIWNKIKNTDFDAVAVAVWVDETEYGVTWDYLDIWVEEASIEYYYEKDRDYLPGWIGEVSSLEAYVCNSEYPDGEDFSLEVTNVQSSNESVVSVKKRSEWWDLEAEEMGEATITVTFKDLDGSTNSYTFKITVTDELVECWVNVYGSRNALPGGTVKLNAEATYYSFDENGDQVDQKLKGESLTWWIEEGNDFATVTPSTSDPTMATVKFNNSAPKDYMDCAEVWVKASVEGKKGNILENSDYNQVYKCEGYYGIVPDTLDPYLEVGETVTFEPVLKWFEIGKPNGETIKNVSYKWDDVDKTEWKITTVTNNKKYTIKRLSPYAASLGLEATWKEDGETNWEYYEISFFDVSVDPGDLEPQSIVVDPEMTIPINAKGKYEPQQIVIENADELVGPVTYKTSNKKIATVSSTGLVKGLKGGEATIIVSVAGDRTHAPATAEIDVLVPTKISSIALNKTSFTYNGEDQVPSLTKINKKKAANFVEGEDYEVEIVGDTANAGSYQYIVRGIGKYAGEVKKTVKINKAKQTITVDTPQMIIGDVVKLDPAANETDVFTYKSSSKKIATVDEEGNVTALKAATVKITITAPECANYKKGTKTIKIKIAKKPQGLYVEEVGTVTVGQKFYLDVSASDPVSAPKVVAADKKSKKIISVAKDGEITALKEGTAKVKVSLAGNATYAAESVTITIYVGEAAVVVPDNQEPTSPTVEEEPVLEP